MLDHKIIYVLLITENIEGMSQLKNHLWPLLYQMPDLLTSKNLVFAVSINFGRNDNDPGVN